MDSGIPTIDVDIADDIYISTEGICGGDCDTLNPFYCELRGSRDRCECDCHEEFD